MKNYNKNMVSDNELIDTDNELIDTDNELIDTDIELIDTDNTFLETENDELKKVKVRFEAENQLDLAKIESNKPFLAKKPDQQKCNQ